MEKQRLVIALAASMGVFFLWLAIAPRLFPRPQPAETQPATTTATATQPTAGSRPAVAAATAPGIAPATPAGSAPATPEPLRAVGADRVEMIQAGSVSPAGNYPMLVDFTNRGAAVVDVRLRNYKRIVGKDDPYPLLDAVRDEDEQAYYSLATEKLRIETFKTDVPLDEIPWQIDRAACTDGRVVFRTTIEQHGEPVMEVTKTFTLPPTGPEPPRKQRSIEKQEHDLSLEYAFRNLTDRPLDAILVQRGPIGIHQEDPRADDRGVMAAIQKNAHIAVRKKHTRKEVTGGKTVELGKDDASQTVAWAALANKYFACIVRPVRDDGRTIGIARAEAVQLTGSEDTHFGEDMTFRLITSPFRIDAGGTTDLGFACYLGPKSKNAFEKIAEYARYNYFQVVQVDFYCCAPSPIVRFMMWLLQVLYWPLKNYGVAIILLVVIVRVILHPITKAGQVNMMKMQKQMSALAPKMEEIKKKYANDKSKQQDEMMALYKEAGISPATQLLTCLPLMLQMPIWAGLWAALSSTVEMRHAAFPFEGHWIRDLASPDNLIPFGRAFELPIISRFLSVGPIHGFNLLPILLAVTMYLQQKYMPKSQSSPTQTPEQMAQQQKIMSFMTVFFGIMLYNAPSGLTLYIMTSNIGGILEQKRIRQHIRELEERKAAASEAQPAWKQKLRKPRFWEWLEKQAEEARRVKSDKKR